MAKKFFELFKNLNGLDSKSVSYLSTAIEKNNLKGFDYIEFRKSVNAMEGMLDKETAIKSAFATAANMGLTKDHLLKSVDHYKNVLSNEKTQFDAALKGQIEQKINGKKKEKTTLKEQIEAIKAKIADLETKMEGYQKRIDSSDSEIEQAEKKITQTKDHFEKAYDSFIQEINKDFELISKIL